MSVFAHLRRNEALTVLFVIAGLFVAGYTLPQLNEPHPSEYESEYAHVDRRAAMAERQAVIAEIHHEINLHRQVRALEQRIERLRHRLQAARKAKRSWEHWGQEWRRTARRLIRRLGGNAYPGTTHYSGYAGYAVVRFARQELGSPYVWGGAGPNVFDCSGLVMYVYARVGIYLPHGATMQQRLSRQIPLSHLRPGDLVFYGGPYYSHHVAIYVGGWRTIEAPYTGALVRYGWVGHAWTGGTFFH